MAQSAAANVAACTDGCGMTVAYWAREETGLGMHKTWLTVGLAA